MNKSERLAYWYLRLNGFLLLEDFVIHPDTGPNQRTDADLLGVRFAHRRENHLYPMIDDPRVSRSATFASVVIAEVKRGECALNGPWTLESDENMQRVLRAIGCFPEATIGLAASGLYKYGKFQTPEVSCRLLAFGDKKGQLPIANVQQILFDDAIAFIHKRFQGHFDQKASVGNWAQDGQDMARIARREGDSGRCRTELRKLFGLE